MTFRFRNELDDLLAFAYWHTHNSKKVKQHRLKAWLLLPLALFISAFLVAFFLPTMAILWVPFAILGLAHLCFFPLLLDKYIARNVRKQIRNGQDGRVGRWLTASLMSTGISYQNGQTIFVQPWDQVRRVEEDGSRMFVYLEESQVLIIPKLRIEGATYEEVISVARAYWELANG